MKQFLRILLYESSRSLLLVGKRQLAEILSGWKAAIKLNRRIK